MGVISLRDRLLAQYGDQIEDKSTLARMVGTNAAYSMAKTPVLRTKLGVMPNPTHRVVTDDIEWHQQLMGKEYLYNGRLRGRDCWELVLLRPDDPLELVANAPSAPAGSWI